MIPNLLSDKIEIDALLIQPTRWCGRQCIGCYVREHISTPEHTHWSELFRLINFFLEGEIATTNQITISVDDLPKDNNKAADMLDLFIMVTNRLLRVDKSDTKVNATFHTPTTLLSYAERGELYPTEIAKAFHMLSFSEISTKKLDIVKELGKNTKINYNHLCPRHVDNYNFERYLNRLVKIGEVVDSIYLILEKEPIGRDGDLDYQRSTITHNRAYIRAILSSLPKEISAKMILDTCHKDTVKYLNTGYGCSANISKFQVWPDGSVTGCPYAHKSTTGPGRTAEGILSNIWKAKETYDFKKCYLPLVYDQRIPRQEQ